MFQELLFLWSDHAAVSGLIWMLILITVLYLARTPSHQAIGGLGRAVYRFMRSGSRAIAQVERQVRERNKAVVLAHGRDNTEKVIEREFVRINDIVAKDLSHYPALHRELSDAIEKLENDYHAATDAPPMPPEWLNVVKTMSELPKQGDAMVANILRNIESEIKSSYDKTLKVYQKTSAERHRLLSAMHPQWRSLSHKLDKTKDVVVLTQERANKIDEHMEKYEAIRNNDDDAARALTASSLTQFFIAGLVLVVATMGGLINFQLIALPMSEMVGGGSYIGSLKTSDIAALVIILIEIAMGLFLLDSLRITQLFPVISHMPDSMRKRMVAVTFAILFILASIEASLAYMRDLLALDREALTQSLAGVTAAHSEFRWIPSIGQMVMGFILPFALAFVAIPLESFIHASRTVMGVLTVAMLRLLAIAMRLFGGVAQQTSKVILNLYDVIITVPLAIERLVSNVAKPEMRSSDWEAYDAPETPAPASKRGARKQAKKHTSIEPTFSEA